MPRALTRLIVILLVLCLVENPVLAAGPGWVIPPRRAHALFSVSLFQQQALAGQALEERLPLLTPQPKVMFNQTVARKARTMLGEGGMPVPFGHRSVHIMMPLLAPPTDRHEGGNSEGDVTGISRMFGDSTEAILRFLEIPHLENITSFYMELRSNRKSQVRIHTVTFRSGNQERTVGFSTKAETIQSLAAERQATLKASEARITPRADVISVKNKPVLFQLILGESHVPFENHPRLRQMAEAIGLQLGRAHAMRLVHDDLGSHLEDHVFFEFTATDVAAYFIDWGQAIEHASDTDIQTEKEDVLKHILRDSKALSDTSQQNALIEAFNHGYERGHSSHTEAEPEESDEHSQQLILLLKTAEQESPSNSDLITQKFREAETSNAVFRSTHIEWTQGPYHLVLYFTLTPLRRQIQRNIFYEIQRTDRVALTPRDRAILSHFFFTLESDDPFLTAETTTFKPLVPRDPSMLPHRMQASVDLQDIGIPAHHPLPALRLRIQFMPPSNPWGEPSDKRLYSGGSAALKRVILPAVAAALNRDRQEIDDAFQALGNQTYGIIMSTLFASLTPGTSLTREGLESLARSVPPNALLRKALEPFLIDPVKPHIKLSPSNRSLTPQYGILTAA